jgi:hypothetical protein
MTVAEIAQSEWRLVGRENAALTHTQCSDSMSMGTCWRPRRPEIRSSGRVSQALALFVSYALSEKEGSVERRVEAGAVRVSMRI